MPNRFEEPHDPINDPPTDPGENPEESGTTSPHESGEPHRHYDPFADFDLPPTPPEEVVSPNVPPDAHGNEPVPEVAAIIPANQPENQNQGQSAGIARPVQGTILGSEKEPSLAGRIFDRARIKVTSSKALESRLYGQPSNADVIHNIEAEFNNDGRVTSQLTRLMQQGDQRAVLQNIRADYIHDTQNHQVGPPDRVWKVTAENGHVYTVVRHPIAGGQDFALEVKEPDVNRQFAQDVYGQRMTKELSRKGEIPEARMLNLFRDLVERGSKSAVADMGARAEGFRNLQSAMIRLGQREMGLGKNPDGSTREIVTRDSFFGRLPGRHFPEAVKSALVSGAIGLGLLTKMHMQGIWNEDFLQTMGTVGVGTAFSFAARWLMSDLTRQQTIYGEQNRFQKIKRFFTLKKNKPELKKETPLAGKVAGIVGAKIGGAHDEALDADRIASVMGNQEQADKARVETLRLIVRRMSKETGGDVTKFHTHDKVANRFETFATFFGGLAGGELATRSIAKAAELAGALGFGSLVYNTGRRRSGLWRLRNSNPYHTKEQRIGVGPAKWNPRARGHERIVNAQRRVLSKETAQNVHLQEMTEQIGVNLDWLVSRDAETKGSRFLEAIAKGEPASQAMPRDLDWLLGGFSSREELILELPQRIQIAQAWVKAESGKKNSYPRISALTRLREALYEVEKEFSEKGVAQNVASLSEQLRAEKRSKEEKEALEGLEKRFKDVGDLVNGRLTAGMDTGALFELMLSKAGVIDRAKPVVRTLEQLQKYLQIHPVPSAGHQQVRQILLTDLADLIRKTNERAQRERDKRNEAYKKRSKNRDQDEDEESES